MVRLRDDPSDTEVSFERGSREAYLTAVLEENDYRCASCKASIFETGLFARAEAAPADEYGRLTFTTAATVLECAGCGDGRGLHVGFPKSDEALKRMRAALHEMPPDDGEVDTASGTPASAESTTEPVSTPVDTHDQPEQTHEEIKYKTPWTYFGSHEVTKPSHLALGTEIESKYCVGGQDESEDGVEGSSSRPDGVLSEDPRKPASGSCEDAGESGENARGSLADRVRAALARLAR
jgi:hypothetical protein